MRPSTTMSRPTPTSTHDALFEGKLRRLPAALRDALESCGMADPGLLAAYPRSSPAELGLLPAVPLPVILHHVVVGFKGRRRAELLLRTYAKDSMTLLHYGYGTSTPMVASDLLVLWSLGSYFCLLLSLPYLFFSSSRLVLFPVPSFTATAGAAVKSPEASGRSVALGVMDGSSADSHQVGVGGQVRSAEDTGSVADSQLLYYTLVRDGAVPAGFLFEFESLMTGNEDDAARQSRQNFRDDVQSAIWLHEKSKEQNRERREAKTAADLFVQAANLKPRRFKNRLARTLAAGPNSRRDAEELEKSRWVHNLTLLLTGTDTPSGRLLASRQSSGQFLGAGLRASTLRGKVRNLRKFMAWLATTHQEVLPTSYLQYIQYLQVRQSEPSNRGALKDCHAAFQFLEEVAGLPAEQKQTSTELYTLMYKEVLSQATPSQTVSTDVRKAACRDRESRDRPF